MSKSPLPSELTSRTSTEHEQLSANLSAHVLCLSQDSKHSPKVIAISRIRATTGAIMENARPDFAAALLRRWRRPVIASCRSHLKSQATARHKTSKKIRSAGFSKSRRLQNPANRRACAKFVRKLSQEMGREVVYEDRWMRSSDRSSTQPWLAINSSTPRLWHTSQVGKIPRNANAIACWIRGKRQFMGATGSAF